MTLLFVCPYGHTSAFERETHVYGGASTTTQVERVTCKECGREFVHRIHTLRYSTWTEPDQWAGQSTIDDGWEEEATDVSRRLNARRPISEEAMRQILALGPYEQTDTMVLWRGAQVSFVEE